MATRILAACASAAVIFLYGCGGGGGDDDGGGNPPAPPAPATAAGVFKDSNVAGLSYTSGGQSGITGADGSFTYETGQSVTFKVGGVTLGSATGKSIVTPLDLVTNGTSTSLAVQNRVRFLMLMDSDGDPSNGITISEGLRGRAANWANVDLNAADLDAALAAVIPDTSVDGAIRSLATAAQAQAHLEATVRCLYSGVLNGTYKGDDKGRWILVIGPQGQLGGFAYSTEEEELIALEFTPNVLTVQQNIGFIAGLAQSGSSFDGEFSSPDNVSGEWTDGDFTGSRSSGSSTAAYKFQTFVRSSTNTLVALVIFDVNANDSVNGAVAPDITQSQQAPTVNASLSGNSLSASLSSGQTFSVNINKTAPQLPVFGTWSGGTTATFGCRLN